MGVGGGATWAVGFKVLVVVAALAEYGVSGAWGQLPSQEGTHYFFIQSYRFAFQYSVLLITAATLVRM